MGFITNCFSKFWGSILIFIKSLRKWWLLLSVGLENIIKMILNPSFIFFSFIALGLSTMGIWISYMPTDPQSSGLKNINIDSLAVFTFSIATLGGIATDYFFEEKHSEYKDTESAKEKKQIGLHAMFFLWASAVFVSFCALGDQSYIYLSLGMTISFWLFVYVNKPMFNRINKEALDNLVPSENTDQTSEIGGKGI